MALVLCTGVHSYLVQTRALLLRAAGHEVATALGEPELLAACQERRFDVAVIGQMMYTPEKRRMATLIRQHCQSAKILELYSRDMGRVVPDADDWLEVPSEIPDDLPERVNKLITG